MQATRHAAERGPRGSSARRTDARAVLRLDPAPVARSETAGDAREPRLEVHLSEKEFAALRLVDADARDSEFAVVQRTEDGVVLRVSRAALDDLVGYVAAKANHTRSRRR